MVVELRMHAGSLLAARRSRACTGSRRYTGEDAADTGATAWHAPALVPNFRLPSCRERSLDLAFACAAFRAPSMRVHGRRSIVERRRAPLGRSRARARRHPAPGHEQPFRCSAAERSDRHEPAARGRVLHRLDLTYPGSDFEVPLFGLTPPNDWKAQCVCSLPAAFAG
jgi:hypothetical protein